MTDGSDPYFAATTGNSSLRPPARRAGRRCRQARGPRMRGCRTSRSSFRRRIRPDSFGLARCRLPPDAQEVSARRERRQFREFPGIVAEIFVQIVGDERMLLVLIVRAPITAARFFAQPDQFRGIRHRQGFQQYRVDQSKNGSGRADPQRERQDRCDRKRRGHSQSPQRIARVLNQSFYRRQSFLLPVAFLDGFHGSEFPHRLRAGLPRR